MDEGVLRRIAGACCESWRATEGERCAGGCSKEELIMTADEQNRVDPKRFVRIKGTI